MLQNIPQLAIPQITPLPFCVSSWEASGLPQAGPLASTNGPNFGLGCELRSYRKTVSSLRRTFFTVFFEWLNSLAICRIAFPSRCFANRIFRIVSTVSISLYSPTLQLVKNRMKESLRWVNFGRRFISKVGHYCTPIHILIS